MILQNRGAVLAISRWWPHFDVCVTLKELKYSLFHLFTL